MHVGIAAKLFAHLHLRGEAAAFDGGEVFGPQPFFALKTRAGRFIHDNLDFGLDGQSWRYVFDHETVPGFDLAAIGVGASDKFGNIAVASEIIS